MMTSNLLADHFDHHNGPEHRGDRQRAAAAGAALLHRHPGPDRLHRAGQRRRLLLQVQVQLQLRGQRGGRQARQGQGEPGIPGGIGNSFARAAITQRFCRRKWD